MEAEEIKSIMGLKRKPSAPLFKEPGSDGRVYPGTMAPVIVFEKGKRIIKPMRYRVRPQFSTEEIPSKYNVFNARSDSLEKRKTWKALFLKNHGLFPFVQFYEWVEIKGKKTLIRFRPENRKIMWAPMIFDHWKSPNSEIEFSSFALITTEPPPEIESKGHDRCPIFLNEKSIDSWLKPQILDSQKAYEILNQKERVKFESEV